MNELVMVIEHVVRIYGKGTAVTGKIVCDKVKVGDRIKVANAAGEVIYSANIVGHRLMVGAIETWNTWNKLHYEARCGKEVSLLLWGFTYRYKDERGYERGSILDPGMKILKG